jgi:3'-5' exoribonuclease
MKSPAVRELKPDEIANAVFLVQSKEIRQKRTGEPYLSLNLSDRTGEIEARMWDNVAEIMDTFERDDFIKVRGQLQIYNTRPQFIVHKLRRMDDAEVDFADFFPASARDPEQMWGELRAVVASVSDTRLRALLDAFLDDPEIAGRYRVAPAAKTIHHAFRAGLLEHVLSLCGLARPIAAHYNAPHVNTGQNAVDWSLLVAGIVLHDIGKIYELTYERGFAYSTEGQLLGHIAIAMRMLSDKLRAFPEFPNDLRVLLEHMILSHHGKLEFGSPKVPLFPEALLLHYLDDMDSKMECMRATADKGAMAEGLFTAWSPSLERVVLRKDRYLANGKGLAAPQGVTPRANAPQTDAPKTANAVLPASGSGFGDKLRAALIAEGQPEAGARISDERGSHENG